MPKIIGIVFFFFAMVLSISSVQASINTDCSSRGCKFVLTNTSGILAYYSDDGTSAGSLTVTVGSGQGTIAAGDGYVSWTRVNSNNVWVYNIVSGSSCTADAGTTICGYGNGVVFGSYFYRGCNASVKKVALDCSSIVSIPTQSGAFSLARDSSAIYVLENDSATVATIVPPAETSSSYSIGRQASDGLASIAYVGGVLYAGGSEEIYTIPLPLSGSSSLLVTLPFIAGISSANSGYLACPSIDGDMAYLVPLSSPSSYISVGCSNCIWASLSDDTLYTVGGWTPDVGVKAWDFTGTARAYSPLTTATSYSVAYAAPTVTPPICGDNTKNGTDVCDGSDLDGQTCQTRGYDYGTLACAGDCASFDESDCHYNCGNGTIEAPEDCDGLNLNSETCTSLGFDSGVLACTGACAFDTTACVTDTCGNGSIDTGEDCDGANLNGSSCVSLGHDAGTLACSALSCTFDTSACVTYVCGNGNVEGTEQCDGANLNGASCSSLGLGTGDLACTPVTCTFNTSGCSVQPVCGNGTREGTEECDNGTANSDTVADACRTNCTLPKCGDNVIDTGEQCDDNNLVAGDGCDENCQIEIPPDCGNNSIDDSEQCDGENLNGQSCTSLGIGFTGGTLACTTACSFNTSACVTDPVCEWTGVLEEVVTIDHPDLAGAALEKYTENVATLSRSCQISCLDANTAQVIAPSGSYCNVKVTGTDFDALWHNYTKASHTTPATIRVPTDLAFTMTRFGGGHILLHDGEDIEFGIGKSAEWDEAAVAGTEGTAEMAEFTSVHPDTQTPGNWYVVNVLTDTMVYCDPDNAMNCAFLAAGKNGRAVLNLNALGDLTQWNLKVDKPSCNGCSQTSGSPDFVLVLVFFGLLLFWLRFRPVVMTKLVRYRVIKRK